MERLEQAIHQLVERQREQYTGGARMCTKEEHVRNIITELIKYLHNKEF